MIIIEYFNSFFRILNHPLNKDQKLKAVFRILWWKFNQLFLHIPSVVTLSGSDIKCICYPESSYSGMVVYNNLPEYPEMLFLGKMLKPQSIFLDVGANIGVFTLMAASKIKKGRIYSFEPIPKVLDTLYQNISINQIQDKVKVFKKVVSDKNGIEKFIIQETSEYSHISKSISKGTSIPSVKLDDFCKGEKINFIDMIKIDVEGAELKVLKGLEEFLRKGRVKILIVEISTNCQLYGYTQQQVIDYLREIGYLTYILNQELRLIKVKEVGGEVPTFNMIAFQKKDERWIRDILKSF